MRRFLVAALAVGALVAGTAPSALAVPFFPPEQVPEERVPEEGRAGLCKAAAHHPGGGVFECPRELS